MRVGERKSSHERNLKTVLRISKGDKELVAATGVSFRNEKRPLDNQKVPDDLEF